MNTWSLKIVLLSFCFAFCYAIKCNFGRVPANQNCYKIFTKSVPKDETKSCDKYTTDFPKELKKYLGFSEVTWMMKNGTAVAKDLSNGTNVSSDHFYYSLCMKSHLDDGKFALYKNVTFYDGHWVIPNSEYIINKIREFLKKSEIVWVGKTSSNGSLFWSESSQSRERLSNISKDDVNDGECGVYYQERFSFRNCSEYLEELGMSGDRDPPDDPEVPAERKTLPTKSRIKSTRPASIVTTARKKSTHPASILTTARIKSTHPASILTTARKKSTHPASILTTEMTTENEEQSITESSTFDQINPVSEELYAVTDTSDEPTTLTGDLNDTGGVRSNNTLEKLATVTEDLNDTEVVTPTITTESNTVNNFTTEQSKMRCYCSCNPKRMTKGEFRESIQALKIKKTEVSSYIRSKTSAPDHRPSSRAIGGVAVVIMVIPFGLIILSDLPIILQPLLKLLRKN